MIYDVAIVGAGIAGASLAAELAPHVSVLLLEAEDHPGYHSTGRSAAFWEEVYGGPSVAPLTAASGPWLRANGFLSPRGALNIGRGGDAEKVSAFVDQFAAIGIDIRIMERAELAARIPGLRDDWTLAAWEPGCADIDVAALHAHYLQLSRTLSTQILSRARLVAAEREGGVWRLALENGTEHRAKILANAAGAWADPVAQMVGAKQLGIKPLRRTVAQLRTSPAAPSDLPLVLDINESFYFKPESGRLWLSPHDENPTDPCDAAAEELDIALAIDRFEKVVDWRIEAVERRWAGLRSFAPDRLPVYGYDAENEGFFWFAGQGGFGIQTAPAAARLAAQMLLGSGLDELTQRLNPALYSPARFNPA